MRVCSSEPRVSLVHRIKKKPPPEATVRNIVRNWHQYHGRIFPPFNFLFFFGLSKSQFANGGVAFDKLTTFFLGVIFLTIFGKGNEDFLAQRQAKPSKPPEKKKTKTVGYIFGLKKGVTFVRILWEGVFYKGNHFFFFFFFI